MVRQRSSLKRGSPATLVVAALLLDSPVTLGVGQVVRASIARPLKGSAGPLSFVSESAVTFDQYDGGAVLLFANEDATGRGDLQGLGLLWDIGPDLMQTATGVSIRRSDVVTQFGSCGVGLLPDGGF
jgi:hypothetical protein